MKIFIFIYFYFYFFIKQQSVFFCEPNPMYKLWIFLVLFWNSHITRLSVGIWRKLRCNKCHYKMKLQIVMEQHASLLCRIFLNEMSCPDKVNHCPQQNHNTIIWERTRLQNQKSVWACIIMRSLYTSHNFINSYTKRKIENYKGGIDPLSFFLLTACFTSLGKYRKSNKLYKTPRLGFFNVTM